MKFIKETPAKGWDIVVTEVNGERIYHTGYNSYYFLSNVKDGVHVGWEFSAGLTDRKKIETPVEYVENFVFEARLKYTGCQRGRSAAIFCFQDADGPNKFETGMSGLDLLLNGAADGSIKFEDGCYIGTWTFKKQGSEIYFRPYDD